MCLNTRGAFAKIFSVNVLLRLYVPANDQIENIDARPLNLADVCILRRKMLKPPIARLPAIKMDFINRPSGETNCIYETKVK